VQIGEGAGNTDEYMQMRAGGERQRQQKKQRGLEAETVSNALGWNNVPRESQCEMPMKQKYRGCEECAFAPVIE